MKSPSIRPETGRLFGIDWQAADEISVASCGHREKSGARLKNTVLLRLANGKTETGINMSMSRARARQVAIALYEASGSRWPYLQPRPLPNRLLVETRAVLTRETAFGVILARLTKQAVAILDEEIEQRQHGGNDEDWADLQQWVDEAHVILRKIGGAA